MNTIDSLIQHAELHCSQQGKRLTTKRKQVLLTLLHSKRALSAYELIDYAKTELGETLQAMSVYRILEFLEGEHLVHKLNTSNKFIACAHIHRDCEHGVPQFLICCKCDRIVEQTIPPRRSLIWNPMRSKRLYRRESSVRN